VNHETPVVLDVATERHYSPDQVAEMWGVHANTIRRLFRGEPGVLEFGSDETRWSRKRKTMRIPESVLIRVHENKRSKLVSGSPSLRRA
jgi:hypothetical protein